MASSFPLLFLLLIFHFIIFNKQAHGTLSDSDRGRITHCGRVIDNEIEARECLNVTYSNMKVPLPVILNQSLIITDDSNFICNNKPPFYTFSCTLYGDDLIWHFNDENVGGFLPGDPVGRSILRSFPTSAPVYNVTAVLTKIVPVSEYNVPFCVSVLIVQPYSEITSQVQVTPFRISCQGHCANVNRTEVCQVKSYKVAEKPTPPKEVTGNISENMATIDGVKAVASLNWSWPENQDEMAIDHYEITFIGTRTNTTTSVRITDESLLTLSYKYNVMLSEANYTAASIMAVGLCGERSEPSLVELMNTKVNSLDAAVSDMGQNINCAAIICSLSVALGIASIALVGVLLVIACKWWQYRCKKTTSNGYSIHNLEQEEATTNQPTEINANSEAESTMS